jgi:hypothetical protein
MNSGEAKKEVKLEVKLAKTLDNFRYREAVSFANFAKQRQSVDLERLFFGQERDLNDEHDDDDDDDDDDEDNDGNDENGGADNGNEGERKSLYSRSSSRRVRRKKKKVLKLCPFFPSNKMFIICIVFLFDT